jgi:fluoride exporter
MTWLAVAVGGALGSMARHWVNLEIAHRWERSVPYATATVNLVGAAVIGVLAGVIATERLPVPPHLRTFIFVGLLGGFTTFSSFMLDSFTLGHGGQHLAASLNILAQNAIGFALVWVGYTVAARVHW